MVLLHIFRRYYKGELEMSHSQMHCIFGAREQPHFFKRTFYSLHRSASLDFTDIMKKTVAIAEYRFNEEVNFQLQREIEQDIESESPSDLTDSEEEPRIRRLVRSPRIKDMQEYKQNK